MARLHLVVRGRVQGVGFRWFVRQQARRLGLSGWVQNLGDGGVEVLAEGPTEDLSKLRLALRHGPPGADVADLEEPGETDSQTPLEADRDGEFVIRR